MNNEYAVKKWRKQILAERKILNCHVNGVVREEQANRSDRYNEVVVVILDLVTCV